MDFCGVLGEKWEMCGAGGSRGHSNKEAILQATIRRNTVRRHSETGTVLIEE